MPSRAHYVPILKMKRGELAALGSLFSADQPLCIPVIEVLQETADGDDVEGPAPSDAFGKAASLISRARPTLPVFVELGAIDPTHRTVDGAHPVDRVFSCCRGLGMSAIPVTSPSRDDDFQSAVAEAANADGRGICVRLDIDALEAGEAALLPKLSTRLGVSPSNIDVLIDFGPVLDAQVSIITAGARAMLATVPNPVQWRSMTFAAGAMPQGLSGRGRVTLPRAEWEIYRRIVAGPLGFSLAFGDYGVAYPVYVPTQFTGAANIRYTIDDDWLIYRGGKLTGPTSGGYGQFVNLAKQLVADPEFRGQGFSSGDSQIVQCASGTAGTGNQTTWRAIGTNHHLTLVGRQVSGWVSPSSGALPPPVGP